MFLLKFKITDFILHILNGLIHMLKVFYNVCFFDKDKLMKQVYFFEAPPHQTKQFKKPPPSLL